METCQAPAYAIGDRVCVRGTDHICFAWPGTVVAVLPTGNAMGWFFRLRLDWPIPAERRPYPARHEVNHMLLLYAHELSPLGTR